MTTTIERHAMSFKDNPKQVVMFLYDMALMSMLKAYKAIELRDIEGKIVNISYAVDAVNELLKTLSDDADREVVNFLSGLYVSIIKELARINATNDLKALKLAIKYIGSLREIWVKKAMSEQDSNVSEGFSSDKNYYVSHWTDEERDIFKAASI